MILIDNDDSDDYDVIVMIVVFDYDELLCRRLRKTMMMIMMIYVCVHRFKHECVHYQFLSPY